MVRYFKKKIKTGTHGYGSKKKHRGGGSRGGRGRAGSHKHHYVKRVKEEGLQIPGHGFHSLKKKLKTINICDLKSLVKNGKVNLTELRYDKLLGKGNIETATEIIVAKCTEKARERIEAKGGKVIME
ncbi:MAG: uL15 family ribosomal protein [Candidatus Aenigmarchaeota archaeon]|nr:uL15 family ribosomal protein [Candidatus Aenigmarchaeota archaeon]